MSEHDDLGNAYSEALEQLSRSIQVMRVTIVRGKTDKLIIHACLPDGCYPFTEHATLSMNVAAGTAEEYLEKNLPGVPFELIGR